MQAVGILGGSFNPIHCGHLALAELAQSSLQLDTVVFVPVWQNPHKQTRSIAAKHRLAMVECAIADNEHFSVWDGEIRREGLSYTIDTIRSMQKLYPEAKLYLLLGADNARTFHQWFQCEEILKRVTLAFTARPGSTFELAPELADIEHYTFASPHWGISSTLLRDYLKKKRTGRYLVTDAVRHYITDHQLYL